MSRRTALIGIGICATLLVVTLVVVAGPELPGPHVREWLGLASTPVAARCEFHPEQVYDPPGPRAPGAWHLEHNSPVPTPEAGAVAIGGYIYMVGGQGPERTEPTVLRFDPRTGEYSRGVDAPVAIDHPVVTAHDGEVILAAGYINGHEPTNRVFAYSPTAKRWRELPHMHVKRGAAAGTVVGDRLYVAGGTTKFGNENQPIRNFEIYDFKTRRWHRGPDMPTPRHHFGVGVVNGKLYFAGGRQPAHMALAAFQEFNPATNRWRRLSHLPIGVGSPAVTVARGMVIVTGGGEDTIHPGELGGWDTRAAYAYHPKEGRWTRLPDMRRARHGHSIAAIGKTIYVFRGIPCVGYGETSSAESLRLR